jgi:putative tryptophan/tyrosine transport system substrate-binding protein
MLRVGTVGLVNPRSGGLWAPIEQGLRELGYVEGQNLAVEYINLNGRIDGSGEAMQELVRRKVDVIVSLGNEIQLKSALAATRTLPIVMVALDFDPFALGYVTNLARPTGNVTGLFLQQIELSAKRVQLTSDAFPEIRGATVFWDRQSSDQWLAARGAAVTLGLSLAGIELSEPPYNYELALAQTSPDHRGTLIVMISPAFFSDRARLAEFALRHRMRSVCPLREFVEAGGLMSYGVSLSACAAGSTAALAARCRNSRARKFHAACYSTDKQSSKMAFVCDVCSARFEAEATDQQSAGVHALWIAAKKLGWRVRQQRGGKWHTACPQCATDDWNYGLGSQVLSAALKLRHYPAFARIGECLSLNYIPCGS